MTAIVNVRYKFILHKLDFSNNRDIRPKILEDFVNIEERENPSEIPIIDRINRNIYMADPVDFDDPFSPLHWSKMLNFTEYLKDLSNSLDEYRERLSASTGSDTYMTKFSNEGRLSLKSIDITKRIETMTNFNTELNRFNNSLNLELKQMTKNANVEESINPEENDIIEVQISRESEDYYPIYFGFITSISYERKYGDIPSLTITTFGISKQLGLTRIIQDPAIFNQFLTSEITRPDMPFLQDVFNDKNAGEIFAYVLRNVLAYKPQNQELYNSIKIIENLESDLISLNLQLQDLKKQLDKADRDGNESRKTSLKKEIENVEKQIKEKQTIKREKEVAYKKAFASKEKTLTTINFEFDETRITNFKDFKVSFFVLFILYLIRKDRALDITAILEHGNHLVYNLMTKRAFKSWYSQLTTPIKVLDDVRNITYYDIFENREGQLIMRPPKYNQLEYLINTNPEKMERIITEDKIISYTFSRQDSNLNTRVDYQFMFPFRGVQDFFGGRYTDPTILTKYGLRLDGPKSNPNVINPRLGNFYSALDLMKQNSGTRTLTLDVVNCKDYEIGRLYFIEPLARVGYLTAISTSFSYGAVSFHTLTFIYVRNVFKKKIEGYDDGWMASLIYGEDQSEEINNYLKREMGIEGINVADDLYIKGFIPDVYKGDTRQQIKNKIADYFKNKELIFFRVLPNILDIIDFMYVDETLANDEFSSKTKEENPESSKKMEELQKITEKAKAKINEAEFIDGFYVINTSNNYISNLEDKNIEYYEKLSDTRIKTPFRKNKFLLEKSDIYIDNALIQALVCADVHFRDKENLKFNFFITKEGNLIIRSTNIESGYVSNDSRILKFKFEWKSGNLVLKSIRSMNSSKQYYEINFIRTYSDNSWSYCDVELPPCIIFTPKQIDTTISGRITTTYTYKKNYLGILARNGNKYKIGVSKGSNPKLKIWTDKNKRLNFLHKENVMEDFYNFETFFSDSNITGTGFDGEISESLSDYSIEEYIDINEIGKAMIFLASPLFDYTMYGLIENGLIASYRTALETEQLKTTVTNSAEKKKLNPEKDPHVKGLAVDINSYLMQTNYMNLIEITNASGKKQRRTSNININNDLFSYIETTLKNVFVGRDYRKISKTVQWESRNINVRQYHLETTKERSAYKMFKYLK